MILQIEVHDAYIQLGVIFNTARALEKLVRYLKVATHLGTRRVKEAAEGIVSSPA